VAATERLLSAEDGGEAFGLSVGERERVVGGDLAALGSPRPAVCITADGSRAGLRLDQDQAGRCEDKGIDFVDPSLVVDELEVRPGAPRFVVRQIVAQEVEGFPLPLKGRLTDRNPAGCFHLSLGASSSHADTYSR
jgi:hypothetical protein